MPDKSGKNGAKTTGTELEQQRRKMRLAAELRANLKRRKASHASAKSLVPGHDDAEADEQDQH